jgi:outer membrane protein
MIQRINQCITRMLMHKTLNILHRYGIMLLLIVFTTDVHAQNAKKLSLQEAIDLGIQNSKLLKLSQVKIDEAVSKYNEIKDKALPTGSASFAYNHAEIPASTFEIGGNALHLPSRTDAFIGTLSLQQIIFAGGKLRYAKESTDILTRVARLDSERDKEDISYNIINAYYNLYKLDQSKKIVDQNLEDIDKQIKQSQQFFQQGIVTKNDVLRFQLQRSNVELTGLDLETNRKIVNYNLNILLGLPENTLISVEKFATNDQQALSLSPYLDSALINRQEIKSLALRSQAADYNIKSIKADLLPTILVGANAYYINPSGKFIPPANSFLSPITLGATIAWNFDRLWTNKNKVSEATIQKNEAEINQSLVSDQIKEQVNQDYQNYNKSLAKLHILEISIDQAQENDRILEAKYRNNVASVTERIDAETQLFQSLINLELAKADSRLAYYTLLKSSGTITKSAY